jgi:subtilase family serine protease
MDKLVRSRAAKRLTTAIVTIGVLASGLAPVSHAATSSSPFVSHPISANPERQAAGAPVGHVFGCQTNRGPGFLVCYSPQQIRTAYHINSLLNAGITGAGHTIVIVDAFQNPGMQQDLLNFDGVFGLPAPNFTQIAPDGLTPFDPTDPNQIGWAGEITLDVQWAHAIAPGANIVLDLAKSNQDADILSATKYAVDNNLGDIISQSFGENESCVDPALLTAEHQVFANATLKNITVFASSGDQGAAQPTCDGNSWVQAASSPASDPLVTAVGGTELLAAPACRDASLNEIPCLAPAALAGTYIGETALNEPAGLYTAGNFSTGGGYSVLYGEPSYQQGRIRGGHARAVPDVAYTGAIGHGVLASFSIRGGFFVFGGTSVGSPNWAGIAALADQAAGRSLGFLNTALYQIGQAPPIYGTPFNDVTEGNNTVQEPDASNNFVTIRGFNAGPNWDATTGLGSPVVDQVVAKLGQFVSPSDGAAAISQ